MATQVVCTLREDKQGLRKQLGCINGIFQLFDRRYLLGLHRHGRNQNRLNAGEGENVVKEFKISSEKAKEKKPKEMIEKNRVSVESSRNSFTSSCSSTTFSSLDCSRRVQTEWQLPSEPTSPNFHKKPADWPIQSADIRNVVKDSMTKEIRVTKDERPSLVMKHVDSPRPFMPQKSVNSDRKDRNLGKVQKASLEVKEVKDKSRLSCDERKSQYSLKSTFRVKELPRLSLDSKQNTNRNFMNESKSEPGSNKRPSLGVVAQLMGLESLTDSTHEVETLKIKPMFDDQLVPNPRWSRKSECKHAHVSVSPRMPLEIKQALQQQEGCDQSSNKPALKNTKNSPVSVYGQMENRLSALEFKTSGKDLRALKQILEAMQVKKSVLENKEQCLENQKTDQPRLPVINLTSSPRSTFMKPGKVETELMVITGVRSINHVTRNHVKESTPKNKKATGRAPRCLSPSNSPEYATEERPVSSPRLQRLKNGVDKHEPSSDSSKTKEQSNVRPALPALKTRNPKIKPIKQMQNNQQYSRYINDGDPVPYKLESNIKLTSQIKLEVTRTDQPKENHKIIFAGELIEDKPKVELTKLTVEQPSPVSVLDAFYIEDAPSPIKKKSSAFNDYEILHNDERKGNHVGIDMLLKSTDTDQYSEFNHKLQENRNHLIHKIELLNPINETIASPCKSTNSDHRYISEILLTSGILKDPESAIRIVQLNPTNSLIKPELFHILEKPNDERHNSSPRSRISDIMERKLIFDCVNDILVHKLVASGTHGLWTGRRCGQLANGEKLLKELWSEIDDLQSNLERCLYDEDDEVKDLVSADVNKNSDDWDKFHYEVPGLVLDIERLIFKDLIDEVVNAEVTSPQYRPRRHRRRLFSM
uniref:protein LONGIFOLIA 1-like n=1 Tax=Erigeron canadensis TaxID=72917 RepID=UPI001CB8CD00|nr:protein LONGIFOLIA 1-like [Erigeron canadensis]